MHKQCQTCSNCRAGIYTEAGRSIVLHQECAAGRKKRLFLSCGGYRPVGSSRTAAGKKEERVL